MTLCSDGGPGGRRGTRACEAKCSLSALSDHDLLARLTRVVATDRRVTTEFIAHLAEVDRRRLYAREACSSMFVYCTERLGLSADATLGPTHSRVLRTRQPPSHYGGLSRWPARAGGFPSCSNGWPRAGFTCRA